MSPCDDAPRNDSEEVLRIRRPDRQTRPLVLASPHSGTDYPDAFVVSSRLSRRVLRSSEDTHVDRIIAAAPDLGVPVLCALMPRVFIDVNRERLELDPAMFSDPLPREAITDTARVKAGLGTVPRIAGDGQAIYRRKLSVAEAMARIARVYDPYHQALGRLIEQTRRQFGHCILLDCHSMPGSAVTGQRPCPPDVVLGDCHGTSCDPALVAAAGRVLTRHGLRVAFNAPYAGGFTTRHYGRPHDGIHGLQIEFNRSLYMDELTRVPTNGLADLARMVPDLIDALSAVPDSLLDAAAE